MGDKQLEDAGKVDAGKVGGASTGASAANEAPTGKIGGSTLTSALGPGPGAGLDTSADQMIQAFDEGGWNLDALTAKAAIGLKSSPAAYIEVYGNWQPDPTKGSSVDLRDAAAKRAESVRKGLQQWGNFPDARLRGSPHSVSMDGSAPKGSFRATEVWFRTGGAKPGTPSFVSPLGTGPLGSLGPLGAGGVGPLAPKAPGAKAPAPIPPATSKRMVDLGDLIAQAGEAVARDKLVGELKDLAMKFLPDDQRSKLDEAIQSGVAEGIKAAIKKGLEAVIGKPASEIPNETPSHTGPAIAEKDLGEHILKTPAIPFDKPPELHHSSFSFQSLGASYPAGAAISIKLQTPDDFVPGANGSARVVLVDSADHQKNGVHADPVSQQGFTTKGAIALSFTAPTKPGAYVLAVRVGLDPREASDPFDVK